MPEVRSVPEASGSAGQATAPPASARPQVCHWRAVAIARPLRTRRVRLPSWRTPETVERSVSPAFSKPTGGRRSWRWLRLLLSVAAGMAIGAVAFDTREVWLPRLRRPDVRLYVLRADLRWD